MTALPSATSMRRGFTLFEVIMALLILGLLSGAVYSISRAALETSKAVQNEQSGARRLEAFLRVARDAFLNLPADGSVTLQFSKSAQGAPVPELVLKKAAGAFGVPSLGGGSLVLAARPQADGSRVFAILRIPGGVEGLDLDRFLQQAAWIPLLPGVEKVRWQFFNGNEWVEEWLEGNGRPLLARLEFDYQAMLGSPVGVEFWIPPLQPPQPPGTQAPPPVPEPPDSNAPAS